MKKGLTIILLFLSIGLYSQNTFELRFGREYDEKLYDFLEMPNGDFIVSGEIKKPNKRDGYIVRINSEGNIISEKRINLPDSNFIIQKIIPTDKQRFLLYAFGGSTTDNFNNTHYIQEYDSEFNLINNKKYTTNIVNCSIYRTRLLEKHNSNYIFYGIVDINNTNMEYFFFETTRSGDSIKSKYYSNGSTPPYSVAYALLEKQNNEGYYCYVTAVPEENRTYGNILELDSNFNTIGYNSLPHYIHNSGELKWVTKRSYIINGTTYEFKTKDQDNDIGVAILDAENHEIIKYSHSGKLDTIEICAVFNSLEFHNDEEFIYIGGTSGYNFIAHLYGRKPTSYTFIKYNKDLDLLEEKFILNQNYNTAFYFKKTSDGGFIYISTSYDYQNPNKGLDAHIIKLDSNGEFPSTVNSLTKSCILFTYPNPGTNSLKIRTAVQSTGGTFHLYNMQGKQVLLQKINDTLTEINTEHLPQGTYIYSYLLRGVKIESGKWVLER